MRDTCKPNSYTTPATHRKCPISEPALVALTRVKTDPAHGAAGPRSDGWLFLR
jgi:hypothetical protein